jgi:hypothetical protein
MLAVVAVVVLLLAALLVYTNFGQTSLFNPTRDAVGPGMSVTDTVDAPSAVGPGMSVSQ